MRQACPDLTGRGDGTTIGGRVTLALDPAALSRAADGRAIALVSGTNGKTTTRTLLVAALATRGPVVSNSGGANLPTGLTAALATDRTAARRRARGRRAVPAVGQAAVRPRAAVLLNLSRDQLDRYAEVRRLAGIWREALAAARRPGRDRELRRPAGGLGGAGGAVGDLGGGRSALARRHRGLPGLRWGDHPRRGGLEQ